MDRETYRRALDAAVDLLERMAELQETEALSDWDTLNFFAMAFAISGLRYRATPHQMTTLLTIHSLAAIEIGDDPDQSYPQVMDSVADAVGVTMDRLFAAMRGEASIDLEDEDEELTEVPLVNWIPAGVA